jgi:uncharacterized protein (TIGR03437 family)
MKTALSLLFFALFAATAPAQQLVMVSGNGQVVTEQFVTTSPLVVKAVNAAGNPVPNVPVKWTLTPPNSGTIVMPEPQTNANGLATANFLGTTIPPGTSFQPSTITATSASGIVNFFVTTSAGRLAGGGTAAPPLVQLLAPQGQDIAGAAGSTVPGAVKVQVTALSGIQVGQGVPNVGLRIANPDNAAATPAATCNAPSGVALTNQQGIATCDLVLGSQSGTFSLVATVGEYQNTRRFVVRITPGTACGYTISPAAQNTPASGNSGTVSVTAGSGCSWTAVSNAAWITVTSGASGTGPGTVGYLVQTNTGAQRTGTVTIAGRTFTITQAGSGSQQPGPLTFTTTPALPGATAGLSYSITLGATGGTAPYMWTATGSLPAGLTLNTSTGTLGGTPGTAGSYSFGVTLRDSAGASVSQTFSLQVAPSTPGGAFTISTSSFPNGTVGVPYQAQITASGGCQNPFSGGPRFEHASGSLPGGLNLHALSTGGTGIAGTPTGAGSFNFAIRAIDPCGATTTRSFTIVVTATPSGAAMAVSPSSLSFTLRSGATQGSEQSVSVTAGETPLAFSASASSPGNWLAVNPSSGTTPASVRVTVASTASLAPGTYSGTVTIASQAGNSPVNLPVTLTIQPEATLSAAPATLAFNHTTAADSAVTEKQLNVSSTAAGVPFNAAVTTFEGGAWLSVSPGSGQTNAVLTVAANSSGMQPGTYTGSVTITPVGNPAGVQTVPVTLTIASPGAPTATPSALSFVADNGAAQSKTVSIGSTGPALEIAATANTVSGGSWLGVSPNSGTTPATLNVTVNPGALPAGAYTGSISVEPDGGGAPLVISVALQVTGGAPVINAVTNAASFLRGSVAPGQLVVLFGAGMGPQNLATYVSNPAGIERTLAGTRVLFDEIAAPVIYTSSGQVSAVVPYEIAGRNSVRIVTEYGGVSSPATEVTVAESSPALFTLGGTQGAILNEDSSVNGPENSAAPGSIIMLYGTGAGQMHPAMATGSIASADVLSRIALPVSVMIDGKSAEVLYAGSAPGLPAGVVQINARVPQDTATGADVPVLLQIGNNTSQSTVNVRIR